jgi:Copper/zinc superoxide dismutase (SODC)
LIIQVSEREKVPRFRTTAIAALAATALLATSGAAYARDLHLKKLEREASAAPSMTWAYFRGDLIDIRPSLPSSPSLPDFYLGATATAMLIGIDNTTFVKVQIKGVKEGKYGAHLHVGPCGMDENDVPTVGVHYNVSDQVPKVVSDQTEVWLNFKVHSDGNAKATATVPFVPTPGDNGRPRSITFHETATNPDGTAKAKLACLPLDIKTLKSSE